ncbi:MAG TPA: GNAT family N-acetyltransferase [Candidatus Eisenbacteria bacterium]|nr:GNAT family N-acetyltransferase [Candidatus Eisenbacteria bacterium]
MITTTRISAEEASPLLEACGLPLAGLDDTALYGTHDEEGRLRAVAGVETYGDVVLLRSVATEPASRGQGYARALCSVLLDGAKQDGVREAFLLTETAEEFFARLGFRPVPRAAADPRLVASAEFQEGRCASAQLMRRQL